MKKIIFFIAFLLLNNHIFGQSAGTNTMSISVLMPDANADISTEQLSRLESKIVELLTNNGLASDDYTNSFVIYPKITVYDGTLVESGMQNILFVTAQLSLIIKQADNGIIYSSISKTLKGSGDNKINALDNIISQIDPEDNSYKNFIETGKKKIIDYYKNNGGAILAKADNLQKTGSYEAAMALLMTIPTEVQDVYNKAQLKVISIYKLYQNVHCSQLIKEAMAKQAANDLVGSLDILQRVDPLSKCNAQSVALIQKVQDKLDVNQKREWQYVLNQQKNDAELAKYRINAIKEIAKAYYSNTTKIQYSIIVR